MNIIETSSGSQWDIVRTYPKGWALIIGPVVYYTGFESVDRSSAEICFYRNLHPGYRERLTIVRSDDSLHIAKKYTNVQSFRFDDWELTESIDIVATDDISCMFK